MPNAPECRVVYVDNDNDPVVLVHARALLTSDPAGVTSYIDADARDPDTIVSQAWQLSVQRSSILTTVPCLAWVAYRRPSTPNWSTAAATR